MAWKLKKWKGSEAEEEQAPEEGYDISDAATPAEFAPQQPQEFAEPEPSRIFSPSDFAPPADSQPTSVAPPPAPTGPSVIPLGPVDLDADVAPAEPAIERTEQMTAFAQSAPVHDLDTTEETTAQPIDLTPELEDVQSDETPDYFAQSVAHAHEAVAAFQQASDEHIQEPEDEPIAFELDAPGQALAGLHAQPSLAPDEEMIPGAPPPAAPAAPPPAAAQPPSAANDLDAFAPYQPASPPAPERDRFFAIDENAGQAVAPAPHGAENGNAN